MEILLVVKRRPVGNRWRADQHHPNGIGAMLEVTKKSHRARPASVAACLR